MSSIYLNIVLASTSCLRFKEARDAANEALQRDRKSVKARYRKGIAMKGMGALPACLLHLYNVIVMDPMNVEARSVFIDTLKTYDTPGKELLSSEIFPLLDATPIYGSSQTAPRTEGMDLLIASVGKQRHVGRPPREPSMKTMSCSGCSVLKDRPEVKFCRKVGLLYSFTLIVGSQLAVYNCSLLQHDVSAYRLV